MINATTVDFNLQPGAASHSELALGGEMVARLRGFLRVPAAWHLVNETLCMCASYSSALLRLARSDNAIMVSVDKLEIK